MLRVRCAKFDIFKLSLRSENVQFRYLYRCLLLCASVSNEVEYSTNEEADSARKSGLEFVQCFLEM